MAADAVLLFDVNGTLLDMSALDPLFGRLFGDPAAREWWFKELLGLVLTSAVIDDYRDFSTLTRAALQMTGRRRGQPVGEGDERALTEALTVLPAHPDAAPALQMFADKGFRLGALTNRTPAAVDRQLRHAGLDGYFEQVLSAEQVRRYKPAAAPYRLAARHFGVGANDCRLIAAHGWDLAGAHAAGLGTAFVARPGRAFDPSGPAPDVIASDLTALAEQIRAPEDAA